MPFRSMSLAAAVSLLAILPARAESLDIKPGLWEVTPAPMAPGGAGAGQGMPGLAQMPPDVLAKLTPEQRAMVQQRLAAMASGTPKPYRMCITQEVLQKGLADRPQGHCTHTVVSSTAQEMVLGIKCTGQTNATGTIHVTAVDQQTVTMQTDMTVQHGDLTMPMHRTAQSRWIADDCGDVKPVE